MQFRTSTDKKEWFYERFMDHYHKLPPHLRSKYDDPSIGSKRRERETQILTVDECDGDQELETPDFVDSANKYPFYIHNAVTPIFKKRKLNETQSLSVEMVDAERERQSAWRHLDERTSYYYSRYLYYCSMVIAGHWHYVEREESMGRINQRRQIFMAEFSDPKRLEQHLAIKCPDPRIPDKYWYQRFRFFSRFDDGIKLDIESWHSVTPEVIAANIAKRCKCRVMVDAMCGAGGNAIAFAKVCDSVIAVDIDRGKVEMARHNAKIYGVEDRIQFVVADFFEIAASLRASSSLIDVVFLSPPWGGMFYQQKQFDIRCLNTDGNMDGVRLFELSKQITPNIAYFLPKNTKYRQLQSLAHKGQKCEIQKNRLFNKVKSVTAYYGNLCTKNKKNKKTNK